MSEKWITIIAKIDNREGWWYATSQQLEGLLVAHQDLDVVKAEIPEVITALYRAQYNTSVRVEETILPNAGSEHAYVARLAA